MQTLPRILPVYPGGVKPHRSRFHQGWSTAKVTLRGEILENSYSMYFWFYSQAYHPVCLRDVWARFPSGQFEFSAIQAILIMPFCPLAEGCLRINFEKVRIFLYPTHEKRKEENFIKWEMKENFIHQVIRVYWFNVCKTNPNCFQFERVIVTNLQNVGWISADRGTKATLMRTIPSSLFKSSTKDLSLPIFELVSSLVCACFCACTVP